jgi:hypothetical protein
MTVITYDKTERGRVLEKRFSALETETWHTATLLPIPSFKGGKLCGTNLTPADLCAACQDTVVVGYGLDSVREELEARGCLVIDAACDEDFLLENARLTALAALGIILTTEKREPRELSVGVAGYGRIGKILTELLLYLGFGVKVFTSSDKTLALLCECGVPAAKSESCANFGGLDILINTAPATIFLNIPEGLRLMELASGDNFPEGRAEKYPSLPAKFYPESAGKAYARAAEKALALGGVKNGK